MRRATIEGRDTGDREGLRAEREVADEPDEIDEVARPGVLDVAWEGQACSFSAKC
jgi:hypothetical protein